VSTRTVVHLLRHGEVHNPEGVLYGRIAGYRLSERGRDQADVVAKALADADLAAVLASPLQRAQETAAPVATVHGLDILTDRPVTDFASASTTDVAAYTAFFHAMLARGVYLPPSAYEAWFVSAAHDDTALERIADAAPHAARAAAGATA